MRMTANALRQSNTSKRKKCLFVTRSNQALICSSLSLKSPGSDCRAQFWPIGTLLPATVRDERRRHEKSCANHQRAMQKAQRRRAPPKRLRVNHRRLHAFSVVFDSSNEKGDRETVKTIASDGKNVGEKKYKRKSRSKDGRRRKKRDRKPIFHSHQSIEQPLHLMNRMNVFIMRSR